MWYRNRSDRPPERGSGRGRKESEGEGFRACGHEFTPYKNPRNGQHSTYKPHRSTDPHVEPLPPTSCAAAGSLSFSRILKDFVNPPVTSGRKLKGWHARPVDKKIALSRGKTGRDGRSTFWLSGPGEGNRAAGLCMSEPKVDLQVLICFAFETKTRGPAESSAGDSIIPSIGTVEGENHAADLKRYSETLVRHIWCTALS